MKDCTYKDPRCITTDQCYCDGEPATEPAPYMPPNMPTNFEAEAGDLDLIFRTVNEQARLRGYTRNVERR